jgi:trehalose synthase
MTIESRLPLRRVEVPQGSTLEDYASVAHLAAAVSELKLEAQGVTARLEGRTIWMVSSTARGGGVAEMLPTIVSLLRDLGIRVEWVVIGSSEPAFFELTKRIHNLIHGVGTPDLGEADRRLYERVNRENADALRELVRPGDLLVVHDPQPLPMALQLRDAGSLVTLWRSHIGLDAENAATRAVWEFLAPYLDAYDGAVFSAPEYIPERLARRAQVVFPGIDPLAAKNRDLSLRQTIEVMCNAGLIPCPGPTVGDRYLSPSQRLLPDGIWAPASVADNIGLLTRPIVTQISRWDRLKGFLPLMEAFIQLKRSLAEGPADTSTRRRHLELARLVLAGPDPSAIQDDPEARDVLEELRTAYRALHPTLQETIAILLLPMHSLEENALMVNALQRASTIVVQNSLREGFGLTIAEAMWKRIPVLSNARACGPRQQVRDGLDGRLVADPEDRQELRRALEDMLADPARLERWGHSAQRRVHEHFLVFDQLRAWGRLLATLVGRPSGERPAVMEAASSEPDGRSKVP